MNDQVELLESLYRASKALDQNKEHSHLLEFERGKTLEEVVAFLEDFKENPNQYSAMMEKFKSEYPNTYAEMSKESGPLSWLNERIYFAEANKFDTALGYRPNPENWIALTRTADGLLEATPVTRTQLLQEGKIKMAKDLTDPSRDFVNTDIFKQALEQVTNNGLAINYQKVQALNIPDHTCFVGGTLVHTERGLVQIQDIQIGDRVLSADPATGQQSYQAVSQVIKTENQPVIFMEFDYWIDPNLDFFERRKIRKEILKKFNLSGIALPSVQFVVTPEHPFWVEGKGWIAANQITNQDVVVDKDGNKYSLNFGGYDTKPHADIYTTADKNIGMIPYYGSESSYYGIPVDLSMGNIISWNETIKDNPNLRKLYSQNTHWKEDLLEQLPEEDRANAHFHGFSQGDWVNPETIQWDEGEGYVTTTVYNLKVENTHTYFVGEYGIWVHNCGGEETTVYDLTSEMIESLLPAAKQYWIDAGISEYEIHQKLSHYSFEVQQLIDAAAALTNETQIIFSPNAAGMGWFVDSTPEESSEFNMVGEDYGTALDASLAKRVDLLTVLVHEIGHVLGLDHASHDHDIMSAVLETGVRRLPTQEDVVHLLNSTNTTENNSFSGIQLLIKRNTQSNITSTWHSDIEVSPQFVELHQSNQIWQTRGDVTLGENSAILQEVGNTHTNLSQAFKLGTQDKVLTFTVKDQHLTDYNNSPDDAFEVALLDAHTGEALFKVSDLNNTDALFNLQANGQNYLEQGIERVINSDGSQTFFINLDQALAGRDVLLSFDLLGFAAADSSVTLNNIRLVAEPLAVNDHYQFDEDTTITGNVLSNDLLIGKSIENVVLVTAPQHGELVLLANGEFSYVPHANYFGQDQFSYYFTTVDGQQSKVATVQLEINSVNDAPVFNTQPQWEIVAGEPLVLDFDAYVQDAENNSITVQIAQQPQNGLISYDAATGHYVYLVDKAFVGDDAFSVVLTDGTESSQPYTFTIHVLASNTAPVLHEQIISTDEDQTLAFDPLANAYDAEGDQLTAQFSSLPQHGRLEQLANGHYQYVPDANYFGTDSFSYFVTDGKLNSQVVNVSITVNAVNDAPVAVPKTIYGSEDQALLLHWNDFLVSDIDGDSLTIKITELPANGQLQHLTSEGQWVVVRINDVFTQSEIESGKLRFIPELNASGGQGYLAQGLGNKKQHYAQFVYVALDGKAQSQNTVMTIDIEAVADKPELVIGESQTDQEELFRTTWEAAPNKDKTSTLLERRYLDGWRLIKTPNRSQTGRDGFEIWSNGDQMQNAADQMITVYANKTAAGQNWLELNDADAFVAQTLGIEREVQTVLSQKYTLTFDYAGRLGFSQSFTQIGIYVDGKRIASYANTSPNDQLNWQNIQFSFIGTGQIQNLQIIIEAPLTHASGRGAMIDNIVLSKSKLLNHGQEDQPIALSSIHAKLTDNDGSEQLKLALAGLPLGSKLNDGVNEFTVNELHTVVDVTNWNLDTLKLTPPKDFSGELKLQVIASSIEQSNSSIATSTQELTVFVEAVADAPSLETHQSQHALTSREVFHTEWRGVYNSILNKNPTVVYGWSLDGWTTHKEQLFKLDAFEVWHSGDQLKNTSGQNIPLQGLNSNVWIRLNDGKDTLYQQSAIERQLNTVAGTTYSLSFDLAGLLGQAANMGRVGVYIDGQQIAVFDAASGQNALNWKEQQVAFEGNGCNRTIRLQLEGNTFGRTAFVSNIRLVETYTSTENLVYAMIGQTSYLPIIAARSNDQDGSEQLKLELSGFNQGTVLTDGTHYVTVSSPQQLVDITLWDWSQIHFASDRNQDMTIQIKATSIEQSNQQSASTLKTVVVKMLGGQACVSPWQLVNGFVSTWVNHVESIPLQVKAHWSCQIPLLSTQLDLNILPKDEDEDLIILGQEEQSDAWLKALEQTAQQNWKQLF